MLGRFWFASPRRVPLKSSRRRLTTELAIISTNWRSAGNRRSKPLGSVCEAVVEKIRKIEGVIMARLIPKA